jgi:UDP-N-acetylmuramoyl-tripeptide--D-alanyl-D-alanine ligase
MSSMMSLQQASQWIPGARLVGQGSAVVRRVHSDTRTIEPGDLFVALKGERFDANDFLSQAKAKGAEAAITDSGEALAASGLPGWWSRTPNGLWRPWLRAGGHSSSCR